MISDSTQLFKIGAFCARISPRKVREFIGFGLAKWNVHGRAKREVSLNVFLELDLGDWLQRLYFCGVTDQWVLKQLKIFVPSGGTFIDVGANVGLYTCVMAAHVGPNGSVMAFEPMRENYEQLCNNIRINNLKNVDAQVLALSSEIKEFELCLPAIHPGGPSGATQLGNPGGWKKVGTATSTTLDQIFQGSRLDLIKIDVEGHEIEVLKGAYRVIERFHPKIFCEVRRANFKEFFEMASEWGYTVLSKNERTELKVSSIPLSETIGWCDFFLIPSSIPIPF